MFRGGGWQGGEEVRGGSHACLRINEIGIRNFQFIQLPCMLSCFCRVWLCNPMDGSPPGFSVHGILQARMLEWVTTSSSRGSSQPRDQTHVLCLLHWQVGSSPLTPPGKPEILLVRMLIMRHTEVGSLWYTEWPWEKALCTLGTESTLRAPHSHTSVAAQSWGKAEGQWDSSWATPILRDLSQSEPLVLCTVVVVQSNSCDPMGCSPPGSSGWWTLNKYKTSGNHGKNQPIARNQHEPQRKTMPIRAWRTDLQLTFPWHRSSIISSANTPTLIFW